MEGRDEVYEEGRRVDRDELRRTAGEYTGVVKFFMDWENGLFKMTLAEYLELPNTLESARRVYDKFQVDRLKAARKKGVK